jgi:hypothetical protein
MKRLRIVILFAVTLTLLAAVFFASRRTTTKPAASPAECLDDYYESLRSGEINKYLNCLGEPYRSHAGQDSFDAARRAAKDVKNRVQVAAPVEEGSSVWLDVDEVRADGVRRSRFHLRQAGSGWVIVAIDPPRELPTSIRYGTRVGEEP